MKRRQVGVVGALWRYPVKSMRGEALDEAVVTERGTLGDRVWALREMKHGGIMSARTFAAMLRLRAAYESDPIRDADAPIRIELPDGNSIHAGDPGADADGFIEDRWLNGVLEIGGSARVVGMRPAIRCAMTTHPQDELPRDVTILRTAWQYHQAYVGVFASVGAPGRVRVGDPVVLAEPRAGSQLP